MARTKQTGRKSTHGRVPSLTKLGHTARKSTGGVAPRKQLALMHCSFTADDSQSQQLLPSSIEEACGSVSIEHYDFVELDLEDTTIKALRAMRCDDDPKYKWDVDNLFQVQGRGYIKMCNERARQHVYVPTAAHAYRFWQPLGYMSGTLQEKVRQQADGRRNYVPEKDTLTWGTAAANTLHACNSLSRVPEMCKY
jgi:hypothetical protein